MSAWRRLRVYNVLRWIETNTLSFTVVWSSCFITSNNVVFCSNKNSWLIIGFPILIMDLSPVIVPPTGLILTHCSRLHQHILCCSPDTASFPVVVRRVLPFLGCPHVQSEHIILFLPCLHSRKLASVAHWFQIPSGTRIFFRVDVSTLKFLL